MLSGIAVRSRRKRPAAKTTISIAPSMAMEWKANITGALSCRSAAMPVVVPWYLSR